MKSSTRLRVSGARPHGCKANKKPVDNKIFIFMLCVELIEYYKFLRNFIHENCVC